MSTTPSITRRDSLRLMAMAGTFLFGTKTGLAQNEDESREIVTRVQEYNGRPQFLIDGKPYSKPVFETYVPQEKYFRQFSESGTDIFCFSTNLGAGFGASLWKGPDDWDFTALDRIAHTILSVNPNALIMPRVYLTTPEWWTRAYPGECQVLSDGTLFYKDGTGHGRDGRAFPSLASERWRSDVAGALKHVVKHMRESDYGSHIFGYMVTGLMSEEWYHWSIHTNQLSDYSAHAVKAFSAWLERKYGDVQSLRDAWNTPEIDFDTINVPSQEARQRDRERIFRDPAAEMAVIDWYLFYNELVPDTMDIFLRAAKEACSFEKVVGAFYCYMFEFGGDPEYGHNALTRLLQSEYLDFAVVTASYHNRALGPGADYARAPITSVRLHGKLWYHDNDTVSFKYDEVNQSNPDLASVERYRKELGVTGTARESIWQYRRGAGFVLGNGAYQAFFDLHGGYFDDPELMNEVRLLNRLLDYSGKLEFASVAQILVVSDEVSCSYATFESPFLQQTLQPAQVQLAKIGAPHDSILLDDLALIDMSPYRMVIFLNCYHLTEAQRALVRDRVLNQDRTAVWCYAAGLFNGKQASTEDMCALTGFQLHWQPHGERVRVRITLTESGREYYDMPGQSPSQAIGHEHIWATPISVEDPQAIPLGKLEDTEEIAAALKPMNHWMSVYIMNPVPPARFIRGLAHKSGIHIYNDRDDTLYANNGMITISAEGNGTREIRFPKLVNVTDPFTGEFIARQITVMSHDFEDKETLLLQYEPV